MANTTVVAIGCQSGTMKAYMFLRYYGGKS